MKKSAFTLIELLVVIAIIAILAAILFPVFAQAKAAAKNMTNLSNMRQIATAERMYAMDYDNCWPSSDSLGGTYIRAIDDPYSLPQVIKGYTKSLDIWYSPNAKPSLKPYKVGYCWTSASSVRSAVDIDLLDTTGGTSSLMVLWDAFNVASPATGITINSSGALKPVVTPKVEASTGVNYNCTAKGGRGYNTMYADSHAGWIEMKRCPR